jgi:hypothetical protein
MQIKEHSDHWNVGMMNSGGISGLHCRTVSAMMESLGRAVPPTKYDLQNSWIQYYRFKTWHKCPFNGSSSMIYYDIKDPDSICTVLSLIYDHETCKTQLYCRSIHSQTRVAPIISAVPFSYVHAVIVQFLIITNA